MISEQRQTLIEVGAKLAHGAYLSIPIEVASGPAPWLTPGGTVVYGPQDCRPKPDWYTQMDLRPMGHWSANNSEAHAGATQYWGPDPEARGGFAAYAQWLRLVNPPAPNRGPHDA